MASACSSAKAVAFAAEGARGPAAERRSVSVRGKVAPRSRRRFHADPPDGTRSCSTFDLSCEMRSGHGQGLRSRKPQRRRPGGLSVRLSVSGLHEGADDPEQREEDSEEEHPAVSVTERPDAEPDEDDDPDESAKADSPPRSCLRQSRSGLVSAGLSPRETFPAQVGVASERPNATGENRTCARGLGTNPFRPGVAVAPQGPEENVSRHGTPPAHAGGVRRLRSSRSAAQSREELGVSSS